MITTESPPLLTQDRMAKARAKSHAPLGNARRKLAYATNAVERIQTRYERELAEAKIRLARCQAEVRYYEELEKVDEAGTAVPS